MKTTINHIAFSFYFIIASLSSSAQILNNQESKLYDLIMEYRREKGLPKIQLSHSLTYVAKMHAQDLAINKPDVGNCNMHSWSSNGKWAPCCYTDDHAQAKLMWSKPKELTNYRGNGYEISYWNSEGADATDALYGWKESSGHNALIINQGVWHEKWNAIGIAIYNEYAVVWFGNILDTN
jgi:uncharacterized protein YkwD